MKEELIKYVMKKADACYADDFPIQNIETWIIEFFDQYQPERLSPEDSFDITRSPAYQLQERVMKEWISDSPNQANK